PDLVRMPLPQGFLVTAQHHRPLPVEEHVVDHEPREHPEPEQVCTDHDARQRDTELHSTSPSWDSPDGQPGLIKSSARARCERRDIDDLYVIAVVSGGQLPANRRKVAGPWDACYA